MDGMTNSFDFLHLLAALTAYGGLLAGLLLLAAYPIVGVLLVLGSMALLLRSVARLCGAHSAPGEVDAENDTRV
jgi:hypothetical protein